MVEILSPIYLGSNIHMSLSLLNSSFDPLNASDAELLSIIIDGLLSDNCKVTLADQMLNHYGSLKGILTAEDWEITTQFSIDFLPVNRIKAAGELGKRLYIKKDINSVVDNPEKVWRLLLPEITGIKKEVLYILVLNNKNSIIKKAMVSMGTVSEAIVHPREVFHEAIRACGSSIVIVHNHPSGDVTPSKEDILTTERLIKAGEIIGIKVLDHVIVSDYSYISMRDRGLME